MGRARAGESEPGAMMGTKKALFAGVFALLASQIEANYFDFSSWADSIRGTRAGYVAGAVDTMKANGIYDPLSEAYANCVGTLKMSNGQLADNLLEFARPRADLHAKAVPYILQEYLTQACELNKPRKSR